MSLHLYEVDFPDDRRVFIVWAEDLAQAEQVAREYEEGIGGSLGDGTVIELPVVEAPAVVADYFDVGGER